MKRTRAVQSVITLFVLLLLITNDMKKGGRAKCKTGGLKNVFTLKHSASIAEKGANHYSRHIC